MFRTFLMVAMAPLALGFAIVGCGESPQQKAQQYNNSVVAAIDGVGQSAGELTEATIIRLQENEEVDPEAVEQKLSAYKQSLETARSNVAELEVPELESAQAFSEAVDSFISFHEETYVEHLSQVAEIATDEEAEKVDRFHTLRDMYTLLSEEEEAVSDQVQETQAAFAADVDMELQ